MFNTIDIHGYTISEAKVELDNYISSLPASTTELTVIHGYISGSNLQSFVRKQYRHKRIVRVILTMNNGETILILK